MDKSELNLIRLNECGINTLTSARFQHVFDHIDELEQQNEALLAQVEEMRSTISIISCDMGLMCDDGSNATHRTVARWSDKLDELIDTYPAQSIDSIKAAVEEETIERCCLDLDSQWPAIPLKGVARGILEKLPRKYQPTE